MLQRLSACKASEPKFDKDDLLQGSEELRHYASAQSNWELTEKFEENVRGLVLEALQQIAFERESMQVRVIGNTVRRLFKKTTNLQKRLRAHQLNS